METAENKKTFSIKKRFFCAAKEIRTPMPLRALPPQGSASTNFAIAAFEMQIKVKINYYTKRMFIYILNLSYMY